MKKAFIIIALLGGFTMFAVSMLLMHAKPEPPTGSMPTRENLVRPHSPVLGDPAAPVVIVEFLDPACETCRAFYPMLKALQAAHAGQVTLVIRYAPFHMGADEIAAMLNAAHRQGKFWPVLEALLATQDQWAPNHRANAALAWKHLDGLGLDLVRLRNDMVSPETAAVLRQDMNDASALQVAKTPEFFVNGRTLPRFGIQPLKDLVREELARSRATK